ncbi:hypothetical protein [Arthrobacter sp. H5]|nr:hypothetical protein [Arthrobacter sp. H5]
MTIAETVHEIIDEIASLTTGHGSLPSLPKISRQTFDAARPGEVGPALTG